MRNRVIAWSIGILCHLTFGAAIALMAYMLATGMTSGILPIGGGYGRYWNVALLLQFPILHSFFLTTTGKRYLAFPFPKEIAKDLMTTIYAWVSSIQLLAVFLFWTPAQSVWFVPSKSIFWPWVIVYVMSWILLLKSLAEAGMAMHTGWLGWRSIVTEKRVVYPRIPQKGLHNQCRHPIYLSFSLIILTGPVWSFDHFILATLWVFYCLAAPVLKERRMQQRAATQYDTIRRTTPYMIPRFLYSFAHEFGFESCLPLITPKVGFAKQEGEFPGELPTSMQAKNLSEIEI